MSADVLPYNRFESIDRYYIAFEVSLHSCGTEYSLYRSNFVFECPSWRLEAICLTESVTGVAFPKSKAKV